MGTRTSSFGVSRREGHDARPFYERFTQPVVSKDTTVNPCPVRDRIFVGDARKMDQLPDNCIALTVTSPPYFAGKDYELGADGRVPASYGEYLGMLDAAFCEIHRVLEPGGRLAVNVANLGRKPYRSLSSDVVRLLEDAGWLLRGRVLWVKAKGARGSCAWGSFASAANPVLRDVTEDVVVCSKGSFARRPDRPTRRKLGLPHENTISGADFCQWSLDTWYIAPASARRAGHPAPFPVELPRRFIELLSYRGDTVLDPFMGSGTTAEAAVAAGRHFVGYDTEASYVEGAEARAAATERAAAAIAEAS